MNDKQNALEIIRFGNPQRVLSGIPCYMVGYLGCDHEGYDDFMEEGHRPVGSRWVDIWGTTWFKEYPDIMGFPKEVPLDSPEMFNDYRWPDTNDLRITERIYQKSQTFVKIGMENEQFLCGSHRDTLWEKAYMLVGMEKMMEYFYTEPEFAREILHSIMDFQIGIAKHYVEIGVDMVSLSDDLGTQNSLILSPQIIYEFLLPEYQRLFSFYEPYGVIMNFHSCGHIEPLLEMFIELGVNILNPVQATANNFRNVIEKTQGKIALCGGISTDLLLNGSEEEIRSTVRETIHILGRNGGYFCAPDQYMPFPEHAMQVFYRAVDEYGRY